MAKPKAVDPGVKLHKDGPQDVPAAKRNVNYTSVSINKTALPKIAQLKDIAFEQVKTNLSTQMVLDFAVELALRHQDEIGDYYRKHTVDPRVAQFLRLQQELLEAGLHPEQR